MKPDALKRLREFSEADPVRANVLIIACAEVLDQQALWHRQTAAYLRNAVHREPAHEAAARLSDALADEDAAQATRLRSVLKVIL